MKRKIVTTISGKDLPSLNCRKLSDGYYEIGDINVVDSGDCYFIPEANKHIKMSSGKLEYDYTQRRYVLRNNVELIQGVVNFNDDGTPIIGYFSIVHSISYDKSLSYNDRYYALLNNTMMDNNIMFKLYPRNNRYISRHSIKAIEFNQLVNCSQEYKRSLHYDSRNIMKDYIKNYNDNYKPEYSSSIKKFGEGIKDLSFGLEFETVKGVIKKDITNNLGLIPLRDGSIEGIEYVTIPLQGNKGLQTVIDSVRELNYKTTYDNNCSLHLHIGNIPRTEKFFLALYKMLYSIQDEMFEMFPFHKKYNYRIKRKHYTKPLEIKPTLLLMDAVIKDVDVKKNFEILYRHLSMGQQYKNVGSDLKNVVSHPSDPEGRSKWNIKSRYYWVNLIPLLFGNKQTVEFRIHTPTTDINKVMNYIFMCSGIINFIIKHQNEILTQPETYLRLSLAEILYDIYSNDKMSTIRKEMSRYIDARKSHFFRKTKDGDLIANEEDFIYNRYINWDERPVISDNIYNKLNLYSNEELKIMFSNRIFKKLRSSPSLDLSGTIVRGRTTGISNGISYSISGHSTSFIISGNIYNINLNRNMNESIISNLFNCISRVVNTPESINEYISIFTITFNNASSMINTLLSPENAFDSLDIIHKR